MAASTDAHPLTVKAVQALLRTRTFGRVIHLFPEIPSTNSAALTLALAGAEQGTVIAADRQTAGRGRLGRRWFSPAGENLYCSVILRQPRSLEDLPLWLSWVPLLSAIAVARAIERVAGFQPSLKWPNDILADQRKLGGLLCESTGLQTGGTVVVVGIGLNVNTRQETFPEDLQDVATSLAAQTGRFFDRALVLATLLNEMEGASDSLRRGTPESFVREYSAFCATLGRRVRVHLAEGKTIEGVALSISPDGGLRVAQDGATASGLLEVRAGDVVHLRY